MKFLYFSEYFKNMANKTDKLNKGRLRSSNITVVISISLVLFLIGIIGMIVINANSYIDYLKEQMVIEVFFKNDRNKDNLIKNEKAQLNYLDSIKVNPYVKKAKYISKEQATYTAKKDLGVDSQSLFEEDIFPASITIALKPEYTDSIHIETIRNQIQKNVLVDEVKSDSNLFHTSENLRKKIHHKNHAISGRQTFLHYETISTASLHLRCYRFCYSLDTFVYCKLYAYSLQYTSSNCRLYKSYFLVIIYYMYRYFNHYYKYLVRYLEIFKTQN